MGLWERGTYILMLATGNWAGTGQGSLVKSKAGDQDERVAVSGLPVVHLSYSNVMSNNWVMLNIGLKIWNLIYV